MIDLHTHSACSDGTFSPAGLVAEARRAGVTRLSLTDHDGIDGLAEARRAAGQEGLAFVGGLEISADYGPGTMHILGYGFREEDPALNERLEYVKRAREERNPKIIRKLNGLGVDVTMEEVERESGGGLVGRPHMAAVLLKKGHVASRQEAFDRYLAKGAAAYVDKVRLSPRESIAAIRNAGGVAVLAHPLQLEVGVGPELESLVHALAEEGLQGMECFYRNHTEEDEGRFLSLSDRYRLIPTGGSDFHGANRPDISLGTGHGAMRVPERVWDGLMEALGRR